MTLPTVTELRIASGSHLDRVSHHMGYSVLRLRDESGASYFEIRSRTSRVYRGSTLRSAYRAFRDSEPLGGDR